jgi:uncharacterized phage-associated protein
MSAPVSAHDVARDVRARLGDDVGRKKLQKLLYYCQAWHLTWTGRPLFMERIEAWDMGPVVADLWVHEKHRPHERGPAPNELSAEQASIVDYVIERYGNLSGDALGDMTHREAPWRETERNQVITFEAMRSFYQRDDQFKARNAKAAQIRARTDVHALGPRPLSPAALAAVDRAVRGQAIRDR